MTYSHWNNGSPWYAFLAAGKGDSREHQHLVFVPAASPSVRVSYHEARAALAIHALGKLEERLAIKCAQHRDLCLSILARFVSDVNRLEPSGTYA